MNWNIGTIIDMPWLRVERCHGPWISLGIHVDMHRGFIDFHALWWIVSVGRVYRAS